MKNFYITTTLPYVNAEPHIGTALEFVQADVLARYHDLIGDKVFFTTGTDEHGQKIYDKARENKEDPQKYVDRYAAKFRELQPLLNLYPDLHFIRTTDPHHESAAQEFWRRCNKAGDIYKKFYKIKYCVGCELEKTDSELDENGHCLLHPNLKIEIIEEENYFFRFSKYQEPLLKLYRENPAFVVPDFRFNEIKRFVERGLEDFSISRLASKMPWGIPVPDDSAHVMYVWFDALINYISTLGWPKIEGDFSDFWPGLQIAGKDQIRMQAAMWQAMLMSAGLPSSKQIFIHGFINIEGQKISKSLGNVINPVSLVKEYGVDALRYYYLREVNPFEDSDFSLEKFKTAYNANLANGLGNLVSRIMKMAETYLSEPYADASNAVIPKEYFNYLNNFELNKAMNVIWTEISFLDEFIQKKEPFKLIKTDKEKALTDIKLLLTGLYQAAKMLHPTLPETAEKIIELIKINKSPEKPLFIRKD
ncbi:MAG TPA: methionine--tRNA ligase [Candidatus Paceibacterota bacterium]|nr:methionine--tRNA ligase [Candidatus Paceibacterota bacterium]